MGGRVRQSGFTLIEVMISVAIMAVLFAQAFMALNAQKRIYVANDRALDAQEGARLVLDLISFDARMAGFMVPRIASISSIDGGAAAADLLCLSDAAYFNVPALGGSSPSLDSRADHFDTATIVGGVAPNSVTVSSLDVDSDGAPVDFLAPAGGQPGGGIIISNGTRSYCATITTILGNTISFGPVPEAALTVADFPVAADVRVVPAIIYSLNGNNLTRNGIVLASTIDDLQVEYWVDNQTQDGIMDAAEFPIHNLNAVPGVWPIDTSRIRRVRISVIARTQDVQGDGQEGVNPNRYRRPALANRTAAVARDAFKRRTFSASLLPRNLL